MSIDIRFAIDSVGELLTEYVISGWSIAPGESSSPTGFQGSAPRSACPPTQGALPTGFAGSLAMLLGGREHVTRSLVDQLVDATVRNVSPLLSFVNELKYATFVWATGLATPNASAGGTISLGLATRA